MCIMCALIDATAAEQGTSNHAKKKLNKTILIHKLGVQKIDYIKLLDVNKLIRPYKKIENIESFWLTFFEKLD